MTRAEGWTLFAAILASGIVFLDSTVVNVALPRIGRELPSSVFGVLEGQSYVYNAYLLTLSALLVLAGALNDFFGRRRMFAFGLAGFLVTSLLCGVAPSMELLNATTRVICSSAVMTATACLAFSSGPGAIAKNSTLCSMSSLVCNATRAGCRVGVLPNKTNSDVAAAVDNLLKNQGITGYTTTITVNGSISVSGIPERNSRCTTSSQTWKPPSSKWTMSWICADVTGAGAPPGQRRCRWATSGRTSASSSNDTASIAP